MHLTGGSGMVVGFLSDFCPVWRSILKGISERSKIGFLSLFEH